MNAINYQVSKHAAVSLLKFSWSFISKIVYSCTIQFFYLKKKASTPLLMSISNITEQTNYEFSKAHSIIGFMLHFCIQDAHEEEDSLRLVPGK